MCNKDSPYLNGLRVTVRMGENDDIKEIISFYENNKRHLAPFEPIKPLNFYTEEFWQGELLTRKKDFLEDRSLKMFIFDNIDSQVIGVINYNQIVRGAFYATYLGYSLSEKLQGQGIINEGLKLAIDYAFNNLNLHRIMANYMPHNRKSGNVLKRLGFTVEGYARDYLFINGNWEDHILTILTNQNWKKPS